MWGRGGKRIQTLIGPETAVQGNVLFKGGIHIDGQVRGNVIADDDPSSVLTLSESGHIDGNVRVPTIRLNGSVTGDVHAAEHIELSAQARVNGDVHYKLIEMAIGAEVNGNLVHIPEEQGDPVVALDVADNAPHHVAEKS